ncbi:hypothetical protein CGQ11_35620, partial [Pseudomonas aeruginosa]
GRSLRETPGSVSGANRASFERRGLRSTQDIANSLPGVNASAPPALSSRSRAGGVSPPALTVRAGSSVGSSSAQSKAGTPARVRLRPSARTRRAVECFFIERS